MEPGSSLGPYRIDRELGSGGMGRVFAATVEGRCPGLDAGTRVAVKVVHRHLLETPGFFKRFLREGEIGRSIRHPNVVRTFDCDQIVVDGSPLSFLSMEYVEGRTLRELLEELDRVPEELCRHIAREVCKGLAAIHAAGVIHRDMKPDNVLITQDHVVKVMDLGVARLQDEALRLSQTGAFVGSIHYAAPECFQGGGADADARADLHALGLVLYELACGLHPYVADDVPQIVQKVLNEEPRRVGDANPQLSPFFEEVVHCLLAKEPDARFASATELLAVLEAGEESAWWHGRARAMQAATRRPIRRIRIPRETAVYGRERELERLRAHYDAAASGDGSVVLIEGEAGIGKSRLVDEFVGRLQREAEDLNFLSGSYHPGGAATAAGGFSRAYVEQFGAEGCVRYLTRTPILAPAFDALLRGEPTPKGDPPLTKDSLQTCFVNATRALGAERTTVVLIDDLHFAPEEGRALFSAVAAAVPGHRVLLLGTTRPGLSQEWLAGVTRLDHADHLELSRLGPKDLGELLLDTLRSERLARDLALQIATKSDGNPFFVFEILRGLREEQFLTQKPDGSWDTTRVIEEIRIPSTVRDLVGARMADLVDDERHLLDVAACWGFEFDPALVGEVLGIARIPALHAFGRIEKRHRLARSAGRNYVFDHHQVQESLYAQLNEQLREEYHGALAVALEQRTGAARSDPEKLDGALCVDLCEHYLAGARPASAIRYLAAAQEHLSRGYLQVQAMALAERALGVHNLLVGVERAVALLRLARVGGPLDNLGHRQRQEECAREAERLAAEADDEGLRASSLVALGACLTRSGRFAEGEAAYRGALESAAARADLEAEATAHGGLGVIFLSQGRLPEAREHLERQLDQSRELGDRSGESNAAGNLGLLCSIEGRMPEAREYYERDLALCRETGDRHAEAITTGNLGTLHWSAGRLTEAREHFERALEVCRDVGDRTGEAEGTGNLGLLHLAQGRLPEARSHLERSLKLIRESGNRHGEAVVQLNLGHVRVEEPDPSPAEAHVRSCLLLAEAIDVPQVLAAARLLLGTLRMVMGDEEGAREALVAARDTAVEHGFPGEGTLARAHLACLSGGDLADALSAFEEHAASLTPGQRRETRFLLWKASGDAAHLEEAKQLLDGLVASVDDATRASMLANIRVNREILAAWNEHRGASGTG